jgi:hypothetical protein
MSDSAVLEATELSIEKPIFHEWAVKIRTMQLGVIDAHAGICKTADALCVAAWQIGKKLIWCREQINPETGRPVIQHGIWQTFLEQCGLPKSTAWNYMNLAKRFNTEAELRNTGLRKGYQSLLVPAGNQRKRSVVVKQGKAAKYMRAANDLHKVLNSLGDYDTDTLRGDLRLLFDELTKLYASDHQ